MKRWIVGALLCAVVVLPERVQAQTAEQRLEALRAVAQRPLRYSVTTGAVDVRRRIPIGKRADGNALTVDLYLPKAPATQSRPIALLLHGAVPDVAPIKPSEWQMYRDWGTVLAQSGVAAVMFDHRFGSLEERRIDEAMSEVAQVMQWVKQSASSQRFDLAQISVVSFSAGGLMIPEFVRRYDDQSIRRYVLYYPLFGAEAKLSFLDVVPTLAQRGTPLLIFRAGADQIPDLLSKLDAAVTAALNQDVALEIRNLPKAPHGFESMIDSAATRRTITRTLEFVSER